MAKTLSIRPYQILSEWTCEELLVAYGVYANEKSNEYVSSIPEKEWHKQKPAIKWTDRWAMPFITYEDAKNNELIEEKEEDIIDLAKSIL